MPCTKAPGTIASRDTAISVLLAARLSNVPRCEQQDSSSAGAQAQQFGSGGHEEAQQLGGLGKLDMALPFLEEPCIPQEKRKLVSSKDSMP